MKINKLNPRKALNKAFLKVKPNRAEIERFKINLIQLLDRTNDTESEEFHKNLVIDFLKKTYYDPNHFINTKGRNDLVIHNGDKATSTVGVIIEAKKPTNKNEMITTEKLNAKAFQELVLYYLRERITHKNLEIKHLIVTNINEWFVFDATLFDRLFAQNKKFVKQFTDFEAGRLADTKTDFFYRQIAEPFIAELETEVEFAHFDLQDYQKPLRNAEKADDTKLIALFKLLSPEHLLKLPFANDSNSLDKRFYAELLHIIGLQETKAGSKKLIGRNAEDERHAGALIENTMTILKYEDCLSQIKATDYGATKDEQLYHVALELVITWINRILFLKLLEGQLVKYHSSDKSYSFLDFKRVPDYDALNKLFFQVLAIKESERNDLVKKNFGNIPYLNSSLFEPNDLERKTIRISNLEDEYAIPVLPATVLKDETGKRQNGELNTLEYLFAFLDAYDFASEGAEEIQEENKRLINASVLGLIFEKINGYKDGSFFTPGFITMYMSRETIRRAVVQKFNDAKKWNCKTFDDIYNKIEDISEANQIINSLKICDPAVGSGHFLVSALNEIIAIKNDLRILSDREGRRLKEYQFEVVNDELVVTDEDGELFEYNPKSKESQRVQEALFHEKQTLIENCLFGVDINFNSVKICRLRLWIELLKNAYYKNGTDELETLPNIDINIKCGNSLISRFALDADLKKALKKSKWSIEGYRAAVMTYRNAQNKEEKRAMQRLIDDIKNDFRSEIAANDPKIKRLNKLKGELIALTTQTQLFEQSQREKAAWNKKVEKLTRDINKLETEIEEIKNNKIYENAFEWRFEFPEVLDDDGNFTGFDVMIGNPPYIRQEVFSEIKPYLQINFKVFSGTSDLYTYFVEKGISLLRVHGDFIFILPNKWMRAGYGKGLRQLVNKYAIRQIIDFGDLPVFEEATTYPCILHLSIDKPKDMFTAVNIEQLNFPDGINKYLDARKIEVLSGEMSESGWTLTDSTIQKLLSKLKSKGTPLGEYVDGRIFRGIVTGLNEAFVIDQETRGRLIAEDPGSAEIIKPFLAGRDIKRYQNLQSNKHLITAFHGIEISNYPAVYDHLYKFESKLRKKAGTNKWYELQAGGGDFKKFEDTKIMYPDISKSLNFALDEQNHYCVNTVYNIGSGSKSLLGYLNSKLFLFYYQAISNSIRGGYLRFFTDYMKICPVPKYLQGLTEITTQILNLKTQNPSADTSALEAEIDQLVYQLYGLTEEEIEIIENSVK